MFRRRFRPIANFNWIPHTRCNTSFHSLHLRRLKSEMECFTSRFYFYINFGQASIIRGGIENDSIVFVSAFWLTLIFRDINSFFITWLVFLCYYLFLYEFRISKEGFLHIQFDLRFIGKLFLENSLLWFSLFYVESETLWHSWTFVIPQLQKCENFVQNVDEGCVLQKFVLGCSYNKNIHMHET